METELLELFDAARKAADAAVVDGVLPTGPEIERCVDALKQLKKFPINYDILVSTQVGKKLRPMVKHPLDPIQAEAADVLELWKKVVIDETSKNKKTVTSNAKTVVKTDGMKAKTVKVEKIQKESTVNGAKTSSNGGSIKVERKVEKMSSNGGSIKVEKKVETTKTVKVEKKATEGDVDTIMTDNEEHPQTAKFEKQTSAVKKPSRATNAPPKLTSLSKCNDPARDKLREILLDALSKVANEVSDELKDEVNACDPIRVAISVESVMFEKMGRTNGSQKVKYRSIMFNLRDSNNPDLRRNILLGNVTPEQLINMTADEMASDERKRANQQIKEKALFECERGAAPQASTDQFKCGRCQQRKCTYYQMQTRSADEPMTTYVTCVNCNNRWKFC